jgi:hypothetical protein
MTKSTKTLLATVAIQIPSHWTPEQAFAVVELIDDLREAIWQHYRVQLLDEYRDQFQNPTADRTDKDPHDPPF